ncbi:MAG: transposase [Candidatus Latescibacteria bacterium]|nr:transposase [Candidatus Latescibacterota bacterium]
MHKRQQPLEPAERQLVVESLSHFDGTRYTLYAYVVMDDHVHVLVEPLAGWELSSITHSWKSFTAHQLQRQYGRQGAVWQDESFDRIVRDEEALLAEARYIQKNPLKRWPETQDYPWMGFPQWENEGDRVGEADEAYGTVKVGEIRRAGVSACPRVVFDVQTNVPVQGGNTAQRREHDKRLGAGTMSRSGAKCPCCGTIMTMEDIRLEGQAGRLGAVNTAVVVDGQKGKEYRLPTLHELELVAQASIVAQASVHHE